MQNCPIPYTFNLMTFLLSGHYDEQAKHQTANRVSLPFPHSHLLGWPLRLCGSFISRLFCPHRQKETDPFAHSDFIGGPARPARPQQDKQSGRRGSTSCLDNIKSRHRRHISITFLRFHNYLDIIKVEAIIHH